MGGATKCKQGARQVLPLPTKSGGGGAEKVSDRQKGGGGHKKCCVCFNMEIFGHTGGRSNIFPPFQQRGGGFELFYPTSMREGAISL